MREKAGSNQIMPTENDFKSAFLSSRPIFKNHVLWSDYLEIGKKKKFNIYQIYKEVDQSYNKDVYHRYDRNRYPRLLFKRGSKLGIEIAATNKKTKIHFALDGIDMESVTTKSTKGSDQGIFCNCIKRVTNWLGLTDEMEGNGKSITSSELRYIYRNRKRLENNVIFYKNNEKVTAPWLENRQLWNSYDRLGTLKKKLV